MVTLANLGRLHGDVVERATLSRDLLAPAAARLSPSDDDLHRRCVLARYIGFFRRPDDVRAGLVAFGDVEAVAVCTKAAAAAERRVVEDAATAWATQPVDSRPAIVFQNALNERPRTWVRGPPGTTEFVPSLESKVNGPRLEADGHLWMDGFEITYYEKGMQIEHASTRVVQVGPPRIHYTLFAPGDFRPMQLER